MVQESDLAKAIVVSIGIAFASFVFWGVVSLFVLGNAMGDCFEGGGHPCPSGDERHAAILSALIVGLAIHTAIVFVFVVRRRFEARSAAGVRATSVQLLGMATLSAGVSVAAFLYWVFSTLVLISSPIFVAPPMIFGIYAAAMFALVVWPHVKNRRLVAADTVKSPRVG